ncbi:hypothetical protein HKX48_002833 [Thoreauomyces humboldtii]|nr:hypothetical protein HKX48_002833 [Thoreauomyces humboldtii]
MPRPVLERAAAELVDWNNTGMSVMELSHRSPEFESILSTAEKDLRDLLLIPEDYTVLWMQGGATSQFSALVYNLFGSDKGTGGRVADYIVTGAWSEKAVEEARRLGVTANVVVDTTGDKHVGNVPAVSEWKLTPDAAFIYYCDNETVHGVEFPTDFSASLPHSSVPIICDMSSNFLSRPVDVSRYGVLFGGAQKNIGPAGVTLVIIRNDLLQRPKHNDFVCPVMMDYALCAKNGSMYNTPPTYAIYISGLVFQWLKDLGGLNSIEKRNREKADALYACVDASEGFYVCPVDRHHRSRMNVPFRICGPDGKPDQTLEKRFLDGAGKRRMVQLKGHRSVGGIRASLYNAMSIEGVEFLVAYMREFATAERK